MVHTNGYRIEVNGYSPESILNLRSRCNVLKRKMSERIRRPIDKPS